MSNQAAKDKLEAEVAGLLPCICGYDVHQGECPRNYRPVVTAWARKRDEQWQKDCDAFSALVDKYGTRSDELAEELAALREENERLKAGKFTDEEFQNLCHEKEWPCTPEVFAYECRVYQRKLFGFSPTDNHLDELRRERDSLKAERDAAVREVEQVQALYDECHEHGVALRATIQAMKDVPVEVEFETLRVEMEQLKAERDMALKEIANRAHFETSLRAERDAAHVAGMRTIQERAVGFEMIGENPFGALWGVGYEACRQALIKAIDAEIENAIAARDKP